MATVPNPPVTLPVVNDSTGVWGTILNTSIQTLEGYINTNLATNDTQGTDIATLKTDVQTLKNTNTVGMMAVSTSAAKPPAVVGLMGLETDTGYLYYCARIGGVATRVPFPGQYMAKIKQTSSQNFTTNVGAPVTFNTADMNRLSGWSSGSRYTAPVAGVYEFNGAITYGGNATGYRAAMWYVNGSIYNGATAQIATGTTASVSTTVVARPFIIGLTQGQYVELWGNQNSGVTLATDVNTHLQTGMQVKYLGYYGS